MEQKKVEPKKPRTELVCRSGVRLDEATSSLHKAVRRGEEQAALYWSLGLIESGYAAHCWRRITAMAWEDIATGDPDAALFATLAFVAVMNGSKSLRPHEIRMEPLGPTILRLCRSTAKSREGDDATWWMQEQRRRGLRLEVQEYAKDEHTAAGRSLNRGRSFWFQEASRLVGHIEVAGDVYGRRVRELFASEETPPGDAPAA